VVARGHNRWFGGGGQCEAEESVYYGICSYALNMARGLTADTFEGLEDLARKRSGCAPVEVMQLQETHRILYLEPHVLKVETADEGGWSGEVEERLLCDLRFAAIQAGIPEQAVVLTSLNMEAADHSNISRRGSQLRPSLGQTCMFAQC
jgi:hypothetical protein